jgi:hypothetical protein
MIGINRPARRILALAVVLAGCSATTDGARDPRPDQGGGAGSGGADLPPEPPCVIGLEVAPGNPVAGPTTIVHVTASPSNRPGVPSYDWSVGFNGTAVPFNQLDTGSEIEFEAPDPGVYDVGVDLGADAGELCRAALRPVNVAAPNARTDTVRLRVLPPSGMAAPPIEKLRVINGGATVNIGTIGIDTGLPVPLRVLGPSGGIPAYLRFAPTNAPDAIIEAFAGPSGAARAVLLLQPYDVLVIPSADGVAPGRITSWSPTSGTDLVVDGGSLVTGTVTGPGDTPLADARVQLAINGVPSTLATTGVTGQFALRAPTGVTGLVTVEVTPDPTSGLPRLSATSSSWNLGVPLDIRYARNLARKDLAGLTLQRVRQGQPTTLAHARVTVVGALVTVGMVSAGMSASASGTVRITTSTDANGTLPSVQVPSARLSAVIEVTPGDLAVVELDTTTTVPSTLDAPPMQLIATAALGPAGAGDSAALPDAVLDVVPIGALAMAAAPGLHVTADASGAITALLASGGHYDLRFRDPVGRRAPLVVADRVVSTIELSYPLPPALQLRGAVTLDGIQAMANASVQLLCNACSGLDRDRPIAETITNNAGQFVLAVPDPGTM